MKVARVVALLSISLVILASGCVNDRRGVSDTSLIIPDNTDAKPIQSSNAVVSRTEGRIVNNNSFSFNSLYSSEFAILGEIENTGNTLLDGGFFASGFGGRTRIVAIFYDSNGSMIGTEDNTFWSYSLEPGMKSPFVICYVGSDVASFSLEVRPKATSERAYNGFNITQHRLVKDSDGNTKIVGEIKNDGTLKVSAYIVAVIYDENDKVTAVKYESLGCNTPKPSKSAPFELSLLTTGVSLSNGAYCAVFDASNGQIENMTKYRLIAIQNPGIIC